MKAITVTRISRRDAGSLREIVSRNSAAMSGLFGVCGQFFVSKLSFYVQY
jgi:hypothetical protein